jgi:small subunit ribosomal protein S4
MSSNLIARFEICSLDETGRHERFKISFNLKSIGSSPIVSTCRDSKMTKRSTTKYHICKKLCNNYNNVWGLPKGNTFKAVKNKRKIRKSYKKLLTIKQSLKLFYCNISEKGFKRLLLKKSMKSPLTTLDRFVSILECRLDVVLFRSCLISSLYKVRQVINHGAVLVNGKQLKNPGTKLHNADFIECNNNRVDNITNIFISRFVPSHLEIDYKTFCIIFLWCPNYKSIHYHIKSDYKLIQRFYK